MAKKKGYKVKAYVTDVRFQQGIHDGYVDISISWLKSDNER